jgi:pyrroline-5-carboxylate reductase
MRIERKERQRGITTILFLGGGRITSAMLAGLHLIKHDYRLLVHDRHPEKLRSVKRAYSVNVENNLSCAIAKADVLVIAVRPDAIRGMLETVRKALLELTTVPSRRRHPPLAISLAAGVPLQELRKYGGDGLKLARAMPSPLCRFGRGLTAVTFPRDVSRAHRKFVHHFFAATGNVIEISENKFDAFTVTYSCSHGYHALAILAKSARAAGLDRETALLASAHALADGIFAWREGSLSLERLLEEAATPGGIAAMTMNGMDAAGYASAVSQGVVKGLRRARANAGE